MFYPSFFLTFLVFGKYIRINIPESAMRETVFIEQNKAKWDEYESLLQSNIDADKLHELFVHITDDLAFARTYYPNRSVRAYLNGLASRVFQRISDREPFPRSRFKVFWTEELPQIVYDSRHALLASFIFFVIAVCIGALSCTIDPEFPRAILGDGYVDMTIKNIQKGDPMAVYKDKEMFGMSGRIAVNNLWVSFLTFITGMLASVGTLFILLSNGVMVGAFQYLFVQEGVFWESFLTIWIHGTLEISTIILAGGAGLVAGSGWLFPGTFTRTESFRLSLLRGFKLYLGIIPLVILAAFFEGYLTRATETPDAIRALFILVSLLFVIGYFVVLPWRVANRVHVVNHTVHELPASFMLDIKTNTVKTGGQIFYESLTLFLYRFGFIGPWTALFSVLIMVALYYTRLVNLAEQNIFLEYEFLSTLQSTQRLLSAQGGLMDPNTYLRVAGMAFTAILSYRVVQPNDKDQKITSTLVGAMSLFLGFWLFAYTLKIEELSLLAFVSVTILPVTAFLGYDAYRGKKNVFASIENIFRLYPWGVLVLHSGFVLLFAFMFYVFLETPVYAFFTQLLVSNTSEEGQAGTMIYTLVTGFICIWLALLTISLITIGSALGFHSSHEKYYALSIHDEFKQIGTQKQIRGLAKE
jgi:uncharacterized membrane protein SpoIIM required for sporulation